MNQSTKLEDVEVLNQQGESLFEEGQLEEAKDLFLRAIATEPHDCRTLNNLGVVYWSTGEVKDALEQFIKAYEVNPFHRQVVRNLIGVLTHLHQMDEAKLIGDTYLKRYPEDQEIAQLIEAQ